MNSIITKQYLSDLIDLLISLSPAVLSFFVFSERKIIADLGIWGLLSIIYFFYSTLNILITKDKTIGNLLLNIKLIKTKNGKPANILLLVRNLHIALFILSFSLSEEIDYLLILSIGLVLIPLKFKKNNYVHYSILNSILGVTFISKKTDFKNN